MPSDTSIPPGELRAEISRNGFPVPGDLPWDAWKALLTTHIRLLLETDFHGLVSLLYRVDVEERKLKAVLSEHPGEDAAELITGLLIARVQDKMLSRNRFRSSDPPDDAEKW